MDGIENWKTNKQQLDVVCYAAEEKSIEKIANSTAD